MAGSEDSTRDARGLAAAADVVRLLDEFLSKRAAGQALDEETLLASHPEYADELREHLELVRHLQPPQQRIVELIARGALAPSSDGTCCGLLDAYPVHGVLGEGGMGIVLDGRDARLNRRVALKVLRPELARDALELARFEREAMAAGALHHPNVVTVHSVGGARGTHYIVMEYVDGPSLAQVVRLYNPLPVALVRRIQRQIMEGLATIHGAGLIHRDIKSSNILLAHWTHDSQTGPGDSRSQPEPDDAACASDAPSLVRRHPVVKIADFGLARMRSAQTQLTFGNSILGTPEYMSPEQARGDAEIDHRTDLYSAGVVLYEMLTGRTPFKADTPTATIRRILDDEPEDPRKLDKNVDPPLASLALRLMAKHPAERLASATDAVAALDRDQPVLLPGSQRRVRRRWLWGVLIFVLILAAGAAWRFAGRGPAIGAVRIDPEMPMQVQVRYSDATEWRPFRTFTELGDRAVVCADVVHVADRSVVVVGLRAPFDEAGSVLLGLGRNGKVLWSAALHHDVCLPGFEADARWWHVRHIVVADLDGHPGDELLVVAQDADYYPARISRIDPLTGGLEQTFWHTGHILDLRVIPDLLGVRRPGILAWGINNRLPAAESTSWPDDLPRPTWESVPVLMVLDPAELTGVSPPVGGPFEQAAGEAPEAYAFLNQPGGLSIALASQPADGADGDSVIRSQFCWAIDHAHRTPRRRGASAHFLLQVAFVVKESQDTRIPVPALIVDRYLNSIDLAPANNIAPEYADLQCWRQWWQPVIQP
jgi:serine/threonine protein kinase